MSRYKTKTNEITETVKDPKSGEVLEITTKKTFITRNESEPFFQVYLNYISWIYGIKGVAPLKLLCKFMELAAFNKNRIELSIKLRQEITDELGFSCSTFTKALKTLIQLGVVYGEKGSYTVNEELLWKGDKDKREALLKSKVKATFEIVENHS